MNSFKVNPVSPAMILGESPLWVQQNNSLLFVDHPGGFLNRIYTETGRHQTLELAGAGNGVGPSVIIPVEGHEDKFLVGFGHAMVCVTWSSSDPDHKRTTPVPFLYFDEQYPKNGLNDAKCDPSGRLWAGTKGDEATPGVIEPKKGALYCINENFEVFTKVKEVTLSNGLTWSLDAKTFFFIDTFTQSVDAFDYNDYNFELSNRRSVFDLKENSLNDHYPDGMTIDTCGHLWVACYNGGKVICIDPSTEKLVRQVEIPSKYTTSCCFGGPDYSTLYVTSATRGMSKEDLKIQPDSGKTFEVIGLGVKGLPHMNFKVNNIVFNKKLEI